MRQRSMSSSVSSRELSGVRSCLVTLKLTCSLTVIASPLHWGARLAHVRRRA